MSLTSTTLCDDLDQLATDADNERVKQALLNLKELFIHHNRDPGYGKCICDRLNIRFEIDDRELGEYDLIWLEDYVESMKPTDVDFSGACCHAH